MITKHFVFISCLCVGLLSRCTHKVGEKSTLFQKMPGDSTGIDFENRLTFSQEFNIYTYRNFYNGGGVALGDINNDGLLDIYFTANQTSNKMYLNKGDFKFDDITDKANVGGTRSWSTGVSMADVNGDGWLDIYVCNSGDIKGDNKLNELFINNKDLTFTERAEEFGVADPGYTTHAVFFDYDKDGDLDLYILNNSYQAIGSFNLKKNERPIRDSLGGDKLMRNDDGHFVDVSEHAGIYGSIIGFGLGVTIGDVNKDGWQDIYVSNDFFERDYLYLNNGNGTFRENLTDQMQSISGASMGADLADVNNDGFADIFVTEMLPQDNARIKTVTTFEDWNRYQYNLQNGYYHQFTRNMLQSNQGNGKFSEIGRLVGVEATDWSWGALMFDMDNDGRKDIFVANGIYQDLTNQDFLQYASSEEFVKSVVLNKGVDYQKLVDIIPSHPVSNYAFHNEGDYAFKNLAKEWGLSEPGFSNGSAYGDLDNDGDLDLVVNNVNMPSFVYRNETEKVNPDNHYLKFILKGNGMNTQALGTKITLEAGNEKYYLEQMPMRGFESTVDSRPNFGVGKLKMVEKIIIDWPDGTITQMDSVKTDQIITINQSDGTVSGKDKNIISKLLFEELKDLLGIEYEHRENFFVDFDRDRLIYQMLSTEGPKVSKGDVNGDGIEDFYIGGAKDQAGGLYEQGTNGKFKRTNINVFNGDRVSEDMGSVFFDADNDGDQDLYVCSGGNEFSTSSTALIDRLYINDGKGNFIKSKQVLPTNVFESTSCVKAEDYDGDGDFDLFVGVRLKPFEYGLPANGYILANDGKGNFTNVTKQLAPDLIKLGMITDASWADVDGDKDWDLVVVGEWMPVKIFINESGKLVDQTEQWGLKDSKGWWNAIEPADLDGDGDIDFIVGNHGLNSRFKAGVDKPVCMYVSDFDQNGSIEQIICQYNGDTSYPMVLRHDLISQLPGLKKKYLKYENYQNQRIEDIFTPEQLKGATKLEATQLSNSVLINEGGKFILKALPKEAQFSSVYGITVNDIDNDEKMDIIIGGNFFNAKPEIGRYDASFGLFLKGVGNGDFRAMNSSATGLMLKGEVRDLTTLKVDGSIYLMASRNNDHIQLYKIK
jgi:enediyne biosynthesis protein E4